MTVERIVLLGAGRLATHLSRALKAYAPERRIVQIYSPGGHSARRLAESLGDDVQVASRVDELDRTADCYLLAVPDTAIAEVAESLSAHEVGCDALWGHLAEVQLAPFGEGLQRIEYRSIPMAACECLQRRSSRDVHP